MQSVIRRALNGHASCDPVPGRMPTSSADEDVIRSYNLGAASFIQKPVTFEGLVEAITTLSTYWFEIVEQTPVR